MTDQPEALRLAHDLKDYWEGMESHHVAALHRCAVVMLREQHAEIERLRADAERYRWMKANVKRIPPAWELIGWDAAIRAAMREGER